MQSLASWHPQSGDPRLRIMAALFFALTVVHIHRLAPLITALIISSLAALMMRLTWSFLRPKLLAVDGLILVILLTLPFTQVGTPLGSVGPFTASREGVDKALVIALQTHSILLIWLAFVANLPWPALAHALHHLGVPDRLVQLLLLTARYLDVMAHEWQRLHRAMRIRGFQFGANWHSWRSVGYLCGMVLIRSLERAERIQGAMQLRGFDGTYRLLAHFHWQRRDSLLMILWLLILAGLIWHP